MRIEEFTGLAREGGAAEHKLSGLAVSAGIAIGPAHIGEGGDLPVAESHIPQSEIDAQRARSAGAVIRAEELSPADTALMDPQRIAGFAPVFGGAEGHTAIVARALGLPAVLAVPRLLEHAQAGNTVVIDGTDGCVIIDPSVETVREYEARRDALARERRGLTRLRKLPAVTRDGVEITLEGNLELPIELEQALTNGAMGLGLVRSEFLYMNRDDLPGEEEQYAVFSALVRGMNGKPVTVRTFDLGGEKIARSLSGHSAEPTNPALGLRAIRLSLQDRRLLDPQLAAMLRAASDGPLRILLPMISTASQIRRVREAIEQVARRLRTPGVPLPTPFPPPPALSSL